MSEENKELYEFDNFRLDLAEHTLTRRDGSENGRLPEKAFQTLCLLVQKSGHLLTKKELIDQIWPDAFVEENNLDKCIHAIRRVLGEKGDEHKYIETVRKHGYRFVADVRRVGQIDRSEISANGNGVSLKTIQNASEAFTLNGHADVPNKDSQLSLPNAGEGAKSKSRIKAAILAMMGMSIIGGLGYFGLNFFRPRSLVSTAFKGSTIEKLPISGKLHSIAISPDEKYLAYVKGESIGKMRLILRQQATGSEKAAVR